MSPSLSRWEDCLEAGGWGSGSATLCFALLCFKLKITGPCIVSKWPYPDHFYKSRRKGSGFGAVSNFFHAPATR
ncbi:hypothetical protein Micbo1qcDRAFT_165206, partial [Microdochium bolleyi]